jgi:excisionase family DNA binding protein
MARNDSQSLGRLCLTVPEAAKMLGVCRNTAYEMAKMGQLPVIRCGQRRLLVPRAAFNKMLQGGEYRDQESKE